MDRIHLKNLSKPNSDVYDSLHHESAGGPGCDAHKCLGSHIRPPNMCKRTTLCSADEMMSEASGLLLEVCKSSHTTDTDRNKRLEDIQSCVREKGTYYQTAEELACGVKYAWRNAPRCIGRTYWKRLEVKDGRQVKTTDDMYTFMVDHLRSATNNGALMSTITVFPQLNAEQEEFRIYNSQMVKYAGYTQSDGSIIGDPGDAEFTQYCQSLGWVGKGGRFDVLPWVLKAPGEEPRVYEVPEELVMRVKIHHPEEKYKCIEEMDLEWYAIPCITSMAFECGGLLHPAVAFNGWYVASEIVRNFTDESRYNLSKELAERIGFTITDDSWWQLEVARIFTHAVNFSYKKAGVTIEDTSGICGKHMTHFRKEHEERGGCPSDFVWLNPPFCGSMNEVFHQETLYYRLNPFFVYQEDPWRKAVSITGTAHINGIDKAAGKPSISLRATALYVLSFISIYRRMYATRNLCSILYGTETGRAAGFANQLRPRLETGGFKVQIREIDSVTWNELKEMKFSIFITSTFGAGDPPRNAVKMNEILKKKTSPKLTAKISPCYFTTPGLTPRRKSSAHRMSLVKAALAEDLLENLKYAVFALGSQLYQRTFCAFGRFVNHALGALGGDRIEELCEADELDGMDATFEAWSHTILDAAIREFSVRINRDDLTRIKRDSATHKIWTAKQFRLNSAVPTEMDDIRGNLARLHKTDVYVGTVVEKTTLHFENVAPEFRLADHLVLVRDREDITVFYPGDHVAVFPQNDDHAVANFPGIIQAEQSHPGPVILERSKDGVNWSRVARLPVCTLRQAIKYYLDFGGLIPAENVFRIVGSAAHQEETIRRLSMRGRRASHVIQDFASELEDNATDKVRADAILLELPVIQSRVYTISNASSIHANEIHVTISMSKFKVIGSQEEERHKYGLCSTYIHNLKPGDKVHYSIKSNPAFHLPEDSKIPLILIGAGSGIAGLRALWQGQSVRRSLNTESGQCLLLFGCHSITTENYYFDEMQRMQEFGVLSNFYIAESRSQNQPKLYVRDLLIQHSQTVYDWVEKCGAHVYVCGSTEMGEGVREALVELYQLQANMSERGAEEQLQQLKDEGQYHEDTFGTTQGINLNICEHDQ